MAGRSREILTRPPVALKISLYIVTDAGSDFVPEIPKQKVDIVYLCYPNNPTGMTLTRDQLKGMGGLGE